MGLTREQILAADDTVIETVAVPEWGDGATVRVKGMTGAERDRFEAKSIKKEGKEYVPVWENIRARLIAMTVVDDEGELIFSEADVASLAKKSAAAMNRVTIVSQRLSGITEDAVEELKGNSLSGRSGSSPSGSPATSESPTSIASSGS